MQTHDRFLDEGDKPGLPLGTCYTPAGNILQPVDRRVYKGVHLFALPCPMPWCLPHLRQVLEYGGPHDGIIVLSPTPHAHPPVGIPEAHRRRIALASGLASDAAPEQPCWPHSARRAAVQRPSPLLLANRGPNSRGAHSKGVAGVRARGPHRAHTHTHTHIHKHKASHK